MLFFIRMDHCKHEFGQLILKYGPNVKIAGLLLVTLGGKKSPKFDPLEPALCPILSITVTWFSLILHTYSQSLTYFHFHGNFGHSSGRLPCSYFSVSLNSVRHDVASIDIFQVFWTLLGFSFPNVCISKDRPCHCWKGRLLSFLVLLNLTSRIISGKGQKQMAAPTFFLLFLIQDAKPPTETKFSHSKSSPRVRRKFFRCTISYGPNRVARFNLCETPLISSVRIPDPLAGVIVFVLSIWIWEV